MKYLGIVVGCAATGAVADVPKVAVDIAPVHSIVSAVIGNLGTPDLIIPAGASPHQHSLRPSEAHALDQADVVVWMGLALTPWLEGPVESLAGDAAVVELLEHPQTLLLDVREGATFGAHDDDAHEGEGHADAHDHVAHEGADPHAWLDPENAIIWADAIAQLLGEQDPENAETYTANAQAFQADIEALKGEVAATLEPVKGRPFVVFHDAFHYFEDRFGVEAVGSVSASDAVSPSAGRVAELRETIAELEAVCALTEPQYNPGIVDALGTTRLGETDSLGADLDIGAGLYRDLLSNMAASLSDCLTPPT